MKNIILISILFSALALAGLLYLNKQSNNTVTNEQNLTNKSVDVVNETQEVEEEIKDGVYTNYKYGFRFGYDDEYYRHVESFPNYGQIRISSEKYQGGDVIFLDYRNAIETEDFINCSEYPTIPKSNYPRIKIVESDIGCVLMLNKNYKPEVEPDGVESPMIYTAYYSNNQANISLTVTKSPITEQEFIEIFRSLEVFSRKLYRNEEYGFQFEYPASKFEESNEFNNEHDLKQWRLTQDDESVYETINLSAVAIEPYEKDSKVSTISTIDTIQKSGYSVDVEKWKTNENAGTDINIVYLARIKDVNTSFWYEVRLVGSVLKEDLLSELEADFIKIANSFELI